MRSVPGGYLPERASRGLYKRDAATPGRGILDRLKGLDELHDLCEAFGALAFPKSGLSESLDRDAYGAGDLGEAGRVVGHIQN